MHKIDCCEGGMKLADIGTKAKNGKDTKHTRHIARRINFVRNE